MPTLNSCNCLEPEHDCMPLLRMHSGSMLMAPSSKSWCNFGFAFQWPRPRFLAHCAMAWRIVSAFMPRAGVIAPSDTTPSEPSLLPAPKRPAFTPTSRSPGFCHLDRRTVVLGKMEAVPPTAGGLLMFGSAIGACWDPRLLTWPSLRACAPGICLPLLQMVGVQSPTMK